MSVIDYKYLNLVRRRVKSWKEAEMYRFIPDDEKIALPVTLLDQEFLLLVIDILLEEKKQWEEKT